MGTSLGFRPSTPALTAQQASVVVTVLLVIIALVVGTGLVPDADPQSALPEPNRTYTPGSVGALGGEKTYPSGLGADGVEDARQLSYVHYRFLENNSRTYRIAASGPQHAAFMRGLSAWNTTVYVENDSRYSYRRHGVAPHGFRTRNRTLPDGETVTVWTPIRNPSSDNSSGQEELILQVYANETTKFWRVDAPFGVHYRRLTAAEVNSTRERALFSFTDRVASVNLYIRQFLGTDTSRIHCTESTDTGDCRTYRVVATGNPRIRGDVANYRATAVVESAGFVRSLSAGYTLP